MLTRRKFQAILENAFWERVSLHPLSNGKGLRDTKHNMGMVLDTRFHIWFILRVYYKMWQKFIRKCDSYFITKCDRSLLQNALGFLLQNTTVLLQNATVITNCDDFIAKRDSYYKMRRLLQNASVQCLPVFCNIRNRHYELPKFHVIFWCWNFMGLQSFRMRKLYLSAKFPYQENRWNCSILHYESTGKDWKKGQYS